MKNIILAVLALCTLGTTMSADVVSDYQARINKVEGSVNDTSFEGQWLPKWNQVATKQLDLILNDPYLSLTDALAQAETYIGSNYNNGWDDFWWCITDSPALISYYGDDVKFDYCKYIEDHRLKNELFTPALDPNSNTRLGGFFWTDAGKV